MKPTPLPAKFCCQLNATGGIEEKMEQKCVYTWTSIILIKNCNGCGIRTLEVRMENNSKPLGERGVMQVVMFEFWSYGLRVMDEGGRWGWKMKDKAFLMPVVYRFTIQECSNLWKKYGELVALITIFWLNVHLTMR